MTEEKIDELLTLAKLNLASEEREEIKKSLEQITAWMQQLKEVDTERVASVNTHFLTTQSFREDLPQKAANHENILKNAPQKEGSYFALPK